MTKSGLRTITAAAKQIITNLIANDGICIPTASGSGFEACYNNSCVGGAKGCKVNLNVGSISTSAPSASVLRASVTFSGSTSVPVRYNCPLGDWCDVSCGASATLSNSKVEVDVRIATSASTGELTLNLDDIRVLNVNVPTASVCGLEISGLVDFVLDLLGTDFGLLIVNLLTPTIDGFIQDLLPKPLGIEGVLNIGGLLSGAVAGVDFQSKIELHGVPGGYAQLPAEGISVGVIVGINADRNTATRGANDASEPVLCMPQWKGPDLAAPPALLGKAPGRATFSLKPAGAFLGSPDPSTDVAIGLSQTVLDLAGHHLLSSGALCVGVGSSLIPQLNLGTVGLLIRSLSELGIGTEPILIQVRPTKPITFDIGTGGMTSPYVTAHLAGLEIDFYALIYERYVRAFTVSFDMDLGVNAEFMLDAMHKPIIVPTLVGLDSSKIKVTVSNSSILRETAMQVQGVFPTVLNLFIPLLAEGLPSIPVPTFEGFTLGDLRLGREKTTQDDFLAIYASLAAGTKPRIVERATTEARVARVSTPSPEAIRAYLEERKGGAMPEVELLLGGAAPDGGALEWQWKLDGGIWRPFTTDAHFVIRDLSLAVQGRHTVTVRARALGDYETTDLYGVDATFVIDSAAPRLFADQTRRDGDTLAFKALDLVSADKDLTWALAGPDADAPAAAAWSASGGRFSRAAIEAVAGDGGGFQVFVRDELGNTASAFYDLGSVLSIEEKPLDASGCRVAGDGGGRGRGGLGFLLVALVPLLVLRARRLRWLALVGLVGTSCVTTNDLVPSECQRDTDCDKDACPIGQAPVCVVASHMCQCVTTIKVGMLGSFSDVAVTSTGTAWVSAYNTDYGDLMVAQSSAMGRIADTVWEFADGVPMAPPANPYSTVRGGINEPGDDVGRFTSIAVNAAGDPSVSHYDKTNQSLRYSARVAGKWTSYAVDVGAANSKNVGLYTTLSFDATGKPGIGYLAILKDGNNLRSEVRWAQAKTTAPASQSDWTVTVVEAKAAPADPAMGMLNDVPYVNGVFINSARTATGEPVLVFYDRPNGNLKLAQWDAGQSKFKVPVVIDGAEGKEDMGWYPSVAATSDGKLAVAYVDAKRTNLLALIYPGGLPEVVDDGLRMDGTTSDGLPRPVYHFVGDNSQIVAKGTSLSIVYQDATAQELLVASSTGGASRWTHTKLAGSDTPYKGAYGFFAAGALSGSDLVMSTFALNQTTYEMWVELFKKTL